jgi:thioester reductase-like protein
MAIFLTGSTGYLGAHVAALLLENHKDKLNLLVRARSEQEAAERLWKSMQLHLDFPRFYEHLQSRVNVYCGDLTEAKFGLSEANYRRLAETTDSVIHCAASLNRKSEKVCLNVNLRGTL